MIPLAERLATLDSGTVYNIYALWFDRPQTGGKAACITALVPVLEDTERIFAIEVEALFARLRRRARIAQANVDLPRRRDVGLGGDGRACALHP